MLIKCFLPSRHCAVFQECRHYSRRACVCVLVTYSCPTLCDPLDCSPPGSSVHGILQARILEWVPRPPPGTLPNPGIELWSPTLEADFLPSEPPQVTGMELHYRKGCSQRRVWKLQSSIWWLAWDPPSVGRSGVRKTRGI